MIRTDGIVCHCNDTCNCQANILRKYLIEGDGASLSGHAYMAPSSLHRTMRCPASASRNFIMERRKEFIRDNLQYRAEGTDREGLINALFEDDEQAAGDGTILHSIFEQALIEQIVEESDIKNMVLTSDVSQDLKDDEDVIDIFIAEVRRVQIILEDADWYACELKVKIPGLATYGTVDLVFRKGGVLYIYDLKTGRQVVVAAENEQFLAYVLGVLNILGISRPTAKVQLGVIAIRFKSSTQDYTVEEIEKFHLKFMDLFWKAHTPGLRATPGEHCLYCNAKLFCEEWMDFANFVIDLNEPTFDDVDRKFHNKTTEAIIDDYMILKAAERHIKDSKQELLERNEGFDEIEDSRLKVIHPKPTLKYIDESKTLNRLKEVLADNAKKALDIKPKPPNYIKKLVSEELYNELVTEQPRRPYIKMA